MEYPLPAKGEPFDIGRVVGRGFAVFTANAALLIGIDLMMEGLPNLALVLLGELIIWFNGSGAADTNNVSTTWLGVLFYFLSSASISLAVVQAMNGERPRLSAVLQFGWFRAQTVSMLAGVTVAGLLIGLILLVIPGLVLGTMWSVAIPAMMMEGLGVRASLSRSRALTEGARWPLFALLAAGVVLLAAPIVALIFLAGLIDEAANGAFAIIGMLAILKTLLGALVNALFITIIASAYIELRAIKDGIGSEALTRIFA